MRQALKGVKKRALRLCPGRFLARVLPSYHEWIVMTELATMLELYVVRDRQVVFLEFLLRVASEGLRVHVGCDADVVALPEHAAACLWISERRQAAGLRLKKRKHRPEGSMLWRHCTCNVRPALCAYHAVARLVKDKSPGDLLWDVSAAEVLSTARRLATLARVEDAGRLTLKAFRASKASNMISAGEPLKTVLTWGEWRSRAVLNYIDENAVEQAALLEATLIASDDEGEPETSPDKMSRWNERGTSVSSLRDSAQVDEAAEACPP